ncbi:hypothetical protein CQ056_28195 [Peribacillus simplex]|uniref:hypothetical protein n=1 Tax=Peribacillus TaxID=2675229 RepID=UPI000D00918D|nr:MULTISPECIES: hypothetical protein [Peribacillus]MCF7625527.1 hypothetical protein [Peribacillus frigoritolerans]PRA73761.1 hypothetical protein CQ056_28195 [Peribacillus simplex]
MTELIDFMIEDIENLLVRVENKLNDPLFDKDDMTEMAIILIKMREELLYLKQDQDVLNNPILVRLKQGTLKKRIKDLQTIDQRDKDSIFTTLINGLKQMVDLFKPSNSK